MIIPLLSSGLSHFSLIKPNHTLPYNCSPFSLPFLSLHNTLPPPLPSLKLSMSSSASSDSNQLAYDFSPVMKIYTNGHIERLAGLKTVPPGTDTVTGVKSKDLVISKEESISARIFLPKITTPDQKFPLLVYFHGGDFCIESAFSPIYHNTLISIASQANVIAVSVNYRNAPEHPVPICHEDSWTAVKWVAAHFAGNGSDEWINRYADFGKVFIAGDSTGANIAHHMVIRVGLEKPMGIKVKALVLVHPFFLGKEKTESERNQVVYTAKLESIWEFLCPSEFGSDDPLINPEKDPNLGRIDCERVLICVAEEDLMRDRGLNYGELLKKSGFKGEVEVLETKGENHVFHVFKPTCDNALALLTSIAEYIKRD